MRHVTSLIDRMRLEAPEMPWAHSLAIARLLDDWAAALRA